MTDGGGLRKIAAMNVGWGIIGIGSHADVRMAPAISRSSNATLKAVVSRDAGRAAAFAAKHGAERSYDSIDDLLADKAVEIVYIGSPDGLHAGHVFAAAAAGKHILCDKPMATSVADAERMIDAAKKAGVLFSVGFNQRYQPAHVTMRELVASGDVGDPLLVKVQLALLSPRQKSWWHDPNAAQYGALGSAGAHVADLLRWVTGQEVVEITALSDATSENPIEELVTATMKLSGGAFAMLDSSRRMPLPSNHFTIHAGKARLAATGTLIFDVGGSLEVTYRDATRRYDFRPTRKDADLFTLEVEEVSGIIRNGGTPRSTGHDGLQNVRILRGIQEAALTGRSVRLEH